MRPPTIGIIEEIEPAICSVYRDYLAASGRDQPEKLTIEYIGMQKGSASIYYAIEIRFSDGTEAVLEIQKADIKATSDYGFDVASKMLGDMKGDQTREVFSDLIGVAQRRLGVETDVDQAPSQYALLQTIYENITAKFGGKDFKVNAVECMGAGHARVKDGSVQHFFLMTKAPGNNFIKIENADLKHEVALLTLTIEIINLLRLRFEGDRHGGQFNTLESQSGISIEHFDATALADLNWSQKDIEQLAYFLNRIITGQGRVTDRFFEAQHSTREQWNGIGDLVLEAQRASFHYGEYSQHLRGNDWLRLAREVVHAPLNPQLLNEIVKDFDLNGLKMLSGIVDKLDDKRLSEWICNFAAPFKDKFPPMVRPFLDRPATLVPFVGMFRDKIKVGAEKNQPLSLWLKSNTINFDLNAEGFLQVAGGILDALVPEEHRLNIAGFKKLETTQIEN